MSVFVSISYGCVTIYGIILRSTNLFQAETEEALTDMSIIGAVRSGRMGSNVSAILDPMAVPRAPKGAGSGIGFGSEKAARIIVPKLAKTGTAGLLRSIQLRSSPPVSLQRTWDFSAIRRSTRCFFSECQSEWPSISSNRRIRNARKSRNISLRPSTLLFS